MTDEEIMDICREECEAFRWPSSAIYIARAIEAKVREEYAVNRKALVGEIKDE